MNDRKAVLMGTPSAKPLDLDAVRLAKHAVALITLLSLVSQSASFENFFYRPGVIVIN